MDKPIRSKDKLLLHICCAPCSTHPITILQENYEIIPLFFNPNIYPPSEYYFRLRESRNYLNSLNLPLIAPAYNRREWLEYVREYRNDPEGGRRCSLCFQFRLEKTADIAQKNAIALFTTTLTIGPNKPASVIFPTGNKIALKYNLTFIDIDFKKKDGFKHSCTLSREHGMYRQNYCGCEYSYRDRNIRLSKRK